MALAHDWLVGLRGGERVLDAIARTLPAPATRVYTLFDNRRPMTPALDALPRRVSFLNAVPGGGRARRWLLPLYPAAVESLSRRLASDHRAEPIHLLVSTSSGLIKGLKPPAGVPHVCYCHAPARYLWSIRGEYTRGRGVGARLRAVGFAAFGEPLKRWDAATAANVTTFLANSTHTAREIRRCFDREADVVFPPVRTGVFTPDASTAREDFWLVVSALEPYKRTDLAIEAAVAARTPLVIAGDGSQRRVLEALVARRGASGLVRFAGRVPDEALLGLYRRARCLLFPQVEDFGIVAVEAQAAGCPVVARRAGGAQDTVIDGVTGALFDEPTPDALLRAMARCPAGPGAAAACRDNAERFGEDRFIAAMHDVIRRALAV